jgi:hypothetical protein
MCVCMLAYIYICMHESIDDQGMYVSVYVSYVSMNACMYVRMHECINVCIYHIMYIRIDVCIRAFMYICMYVCMYVCMNVSMYVYII